MEETMIITTEVPNKRRKVTKFALAGVAVLAVAAAASSSAGPAGTVDRTSSVDYDVDEIQTIGVSN